MAKKFLALVLAVVISIGAIGTFATVSAQDVSIFNLDSCQRSSTLVFDGKNATCKSYFLDMSEAYASIKVEQSLEKMILGVVPLPIGDPVSTTEYNRSSLSYVVKYLNMSEGTYRVKSVFTATTKDGKTGTFTVYSDKKQCSAS